MTVQSRDIDISLSNLEVVYKVPLRDSGTRAAFRTLFHREMKEVAAVKDVTLDIVKGARIGLIGPNGAGKTSLMKVLSGLLRPTGGQVNVLGFNPFTRDSAFLRQISLLRGSRPVSVSPEMTVLDALEFQRVLYSVGKREYSDSLDLLVTILGIDAVLSRQVRALSLGERMRAGLALSLIYSPRILFFDEPTIGLDSSAARATREMLNDYLSATGATLLLTSHDLFDVKEVSTRMLILHQGAIIFDGNDTQLRDLVPPLRLIRVRTVGGAEPPSSVAWRQVGDAYEASIHRNESAELCSELLGRSDVEDVTVEDAPLDVVVDAVYQAQARCRR